MNSLQTETNCDNRIESTRKPLWVSVGDVARSRRIVDGERSIDGVCADKEKGRKELQWVFVWREEGEVNTRGRGWCFAGGLAE